MNDIGWTTRAFNQVNGILKNNPDRVPQVAAALKELHRGLKDEGASFGESRAGNTRVCFVGRLVVFYWMHERLPMAVITRIHLNPKSFL